MSDETIEPAELTACPMCSCRELTSLMAPDDAGDGLARLFLCVACGSSFTQAGVEALARGVKTFARDPFEAMRRR